MYVGDCVVDGCDVSVSNVVGCVGSGGRSNSTKV